MISYRLVIAEAQPCPLVARSVLSGKILSMYTPACENANQGGDVTPTDMGKMH